MSSFGVFVHCLLNQNLAFLIEGVSGLSYISIMFQLTQYGLLSNSLWAFLTTDLKSSSVKILPKSSWANCAKIKSSCDQILGLTENLLALLFLGRPDDIVCFGAILKLEVNSITSIWRAFINVRNSTRHCCWYLEICTNFQLFLYWCYSLKKGTYFFSKKEQNITIQVNGGRTTKHVRFIPSNILNFLLWRRKLPYRLVTNAQECLPELFGWNHAQISCSHFLWLSSLGKSRLKRKASIRSISMRCSGNLISRPRGDGRGGNSFLFVEANPLIWC